MPEPTALPDFLAELRRRVAGDVRTDRYTRILYSTDASIYQALPYGVLIPRSEEDVHAAVELAHRYRIPLLPRTSGTSLAGQAVNEALVLDFSRHLDRILEVNAEERWVRLQPGVVLDELNAHLAPYGLKFGPDPASSNRAALGGIVSNNSTGAHSILYGMTADHVLEVRGFLSDGSPVHFRPLEPAMLEQKLRADGLEGEVYRTVHRIAREKGEVIRRGTPRHWRRCGGYNLDRFVEGASFRWPRDGRFNLAKLISGSEGTLAVITEVKLNLVPTPRHKGLAVVPFDRLYDALASVPAILETEPAAVELLDHLGLTLAREVPAYARLLQGFLPGDPYCVLLVEYYGESPQEVAAKVEGLKAHLARRRIGGEVVPVLEPARQQDVWTVRKVGLGLLMSIKGDHKPIPFIEDAAVPVEHLAEYVTRVEAFCNERGIRVAYYAHASAGCIHIRPLINTKAAREVALLPEIARFAAELVSGYGGAFSSEHGDGRARSWLNEAFFGPELYALFKEVKAAFDPHNLLNPGNIVDAPAMTEHLRYGPDYRTVELKTHLDWSRDLGFARAVEMCNGAGVCRKKTTGTMCPSFMVTREEEHSTRGRANLLRAALSGLLPPEELTGPRIYQALDLCVECKACKAECPSSVDMTKIKIEVLAQHHDRHGVPLRTRLFAHLPDLSRLAAGPQAPLVNGLLSSRIVRWGMDRWLGIDRRRPLPPFARTPFTAWFRRRNGAARREGPPVVLFHDTFTTYQEVEVAVAAVEVLEAAGFRVELPGHRCCGRTFLSKGLVERARRLARQTVDRLYPFAAEGVPIVGLEPSCLLTLRDEYFDLLPGDERVKVVAEQALTFEEFFARLADEGRLNLTFETTPRRILLHGHCHQKALVGTNPARRVLSLPPNYAVEEVDSGCCGLAGAFGYEREHYDLSLAMAERRLLPAVRAADPDVWIAAAGTSCRHQIRHGTGREALHPAQILRRALAG